MPRHRAAVDVLGEREAFAAPARRDLDQHVAELAVAARLLLVPPARLHRVADRLAIGDRRLAGSRPARRTASASRSTVTRRCISPWPYSFSSPTLGSCTKVERGVLLGELGERRGDPHLVLAVLDVDGDRLGRRRRRDGSGRRSGAVLPSAKRSPVATLPAAGKRPCRPLRRARIFDDIAPISRMQTGDALLAAARADDCAPSAKAPRSTRASDNLPPWAVWMVRTTWASGGPSPATPSRSRVCAMPGASWRSAFNSRVTPWPCGRRAHQQRHDAALAQFAREIVEHLVARRLDVADQLLHQFVVVVGEPLQHRIARLLLVGGEACRHFDHFRRRGFAVDEGALQREIDEAGGDAVFPDRDLAQQQRRARGRLQKLQGLAHAAAGEIDLVEEQQARNLQFLELAQDHCSGCTLRGSASHTTTAASQTGSACAHVVHELDRARAIDERHAVAHVIDMGDVGLDAHLMRARLGAGIADAGAFAHDPCRATPPPRASKPSSRLVLPLWNGPTRAISRGPAIRCSPCPELSAIFLFPPKSAAETRRPAPVSHAGAALRAAQADVCMTISRVAR